MAERPAQALPGVHPTRSRDSGDRADVQSAGRVQVCLLRAPAVRGLCPTGVEDPGLLEGTLLGVTVAG